MAELKDFSELIGSLHNRTAKLAESINETNLLVINTKRQISTTKDFDTTIAYEGDINSQIITIQCPLYYDQHDLSGCARKELKWKNIASGMEGVSPLHISEKSVDIFYLQWAVPADACTKAGTIKISIALYDYIQAEEGQPSYIAFSWNTSEFSALSVGKSLDAVDLAFPARDEILVIDEETKNIIAPVGYNNTICTYGDVGVSEVYFLVNRYLGKNNAIDVLNGEINIYVVINGRQGKCSSETEEIITKQLYTAEISGRNNEGLVLIKWKIPQEITAGSNGPGTFSIMLEFYTSDKKWFSNTYSHLNISTSLIQFEPGETEEWLLFESAVETVIEKYFNNNNVIISDE